VRRRRCPLVVVLALLILPCLKVDRTFAATGVRRSRSDKDTAAIGHRNLVREKGRGDWYSLDREKEIGKQFSVEIERSVKVLNDREMTDYVARVAERVARNSDAQVPITVRLVDSEQVEAFTLPGGYQYISRGLLLRLENEGELASVLARGIAHTALRSATRLMTREALAKAASIPIIFVGYGVPFNGSSGIAIPLTMWSFRRRFELDADYFGIQYVHKAGYETQSFVRVVERIWPASSASEQLFSLFPSTPDRLKALRKEIAGLLPERNGGVASTPEFEEFKERLRSWRPQEPAEPTQTGEKPVADE
jgi:beta-barrel assembly-enhancing protease